MSRSECDHQNITIITQTIIKAKTLVLMNDANPNPKPNLNPYPSNLKPGTFSVILFNSFQTSQTLASYKKNRTKQNYKQSTKNTITSNYNSVLEHCVRSPDHRICALHDSGNSTPPPLSPPPPSVILPLPSPLPQPPPLTQIPKLRGEKTDLREIQSYRQMRKPKV